MRFEVFSALQTGLTPGGSYEYAPYERASIQVLFDEDFEGKFLVHPLGTDFVFRRLTFREGYFASSINDTDFNARFSQGCELTGREKSYFFEIHPSLPGLVSTQLHRNWTIIGPCYEEFTPYLCDLKYQAGLCPPHIIDPLDYHAFLEAIVELDEMSIPHFDQLCLAKVSDAIARLKVLTDPNRAVLIRERFNRETAHSPKILPLHGKQDVVMDFYASNWYENYGSHYEQFIELAKSTLCAITGRVLIAR